MTAFDDIYNSAVFERIRKINRALFPAAALILLFFSSEYNYLLFHAIVEFFAIVVAWSIFVITWNSRHVMDNAYFLFMGIGFLFIGAIDFLHVLAYKGMPIFKGYDADLPTQLWIAWQILLAFTFAAAPAYMKHQFDEKAVVTLYAIVCSFLVLFIFKGWFPHCFIEGAGLTPFKKITEILTSVVILASLIPLWRSSHLFSRKVIKMTTYGLLAAAGGKTAFIFYVDVYGLSNLIGHYLMVISFFFIYKAIVETGISQPTDILFRKLKSREMELETAGRSLRAATEELEEIIDIRTRELQAANIQLSNEICEHHETESLLKRRNEELEAMYRRLDDFTRIISHDLREPLRGIYNYTRLMIKDFSDRLNPEGCSLLEDIAELAGRQEERIQAVIQYSRIDLADPKPVDTDLSKVLEDVIEDLRFLIDDACAEIRVVDTLPAVTCDRNLISVVFTNLINNALKYNDKEKKRVEIGYQRKDHMVELFCRDNGLGIDSEDYGLIFRMFTRVHEPHEYGGGSGSGLTIVKKIIEHHQGRIWVDSVPGQGSVFYFTLPDKME